MSNLNAEKDLTFEQKVVLDAIYRIDNLRAKRKMSKIKFEKLLFLLGKMHRSELEEINNTFEPYAMGPYSEYIEDDILGPMKDLGLIRDYKEITPQGREIAEQILQHDEALKKIDESLKILINTLLPLKDNDIFYLVYNLYPDYAERSQVRDMAKSEIFETFRIDLKKMNEKSGNIFEITSDKGNKLKVKIENGIIEINEKEEDQ